MRFPSDWLWFNYEQYSLFGTTQVYSTNYFLVYFKYGVIFFFRHKKKSIHFSKLYLKTHFCVILSYNKPLSVDTYVYNIMYVTIDVYCAHLIENYNVRHVLGIYWVRNSCDKCVRRANNCYKKIQIIKLYSLEQNIIH